MRESVCVGGLWCERESGGGVFLFSFNAAAAGGATKHTAGEGLARPHPFFLFPRGSPLLGAFARVKRMRVCAVSLWVGVQARGQKKSVDRSLLTHTRSHPRQRRGVLLFPLRRCGPLLPCLSTLPLLATPAAHALGKTRPAGTTKQKKHTPTDASPPPPPPVARRARAHLCRPADRLHSSRQWVAPPPLRRGAPGRRRGRGRVGRHARSVDRRAALRGGLVGRRRPGRRLACSRHLHPWLPLARRRPRGGGRARGRAGWSRGPHSAPRGGCRPPGARPGGGDAVAVPCAPWPPPRGRCPWPQRRPPARPRWGGRLCEEASPSTPSPSLPWQPRVPPWPPPRPV